MVIRLVLDTPLMALNVTAVVTVRLDSTRTVTGPLTPLVESAVANAPQD